jgi:hypothetical protein
MHVTLGEDLIGRIQETGKQEAQLVPQKCDLHEADAEIRGWRG